MDDHTAITELTHRYCWAIDDRDWPALEALFTPDATARLADRDFQHRAAIVAHCRSVLSPLDASHHMVSNHLIDVDGDRATSRCYVQAQHTRLALDGGENWLLGGRYHDTLARTEHGWRITHRTLASVWTDGNLAVFRP